MLAAFLEQQFGLPSAVADSLLAGLVPWAEARLNRFADGLKIRELELSSDDLLKEDKIELLVTTLPYVSALRDDQVIDGLARVVREGLTSDTTDKIDEVFEYRDTIARLSRGHLHLIAELQSADPLTGKGRDLIARDQPSIKAFLDKLVGECEYLGLIYDASSGTIDQPGYLGRRYAATEFGRRVWAYLEGTEPDTASESGAR